jgi:hypothetical protein
MRKILITTAVLAGLGAILAVAQASQDTTSEPEPVSRSRESDRKEADRIATPRDDRTRNSGGSHREQRRHAQEEDEDDDRD